MKPSTFAFFVACLAVVEHAFLFIVFVTMRPPGTGLFCLLEFGHVLLAGLVYFSLQRIHSDPVLPLLLTAAAALVAPWTMIFFPWKLPVGLNWVIGFLAPYLFAP